MNKLYLTLKESWKEGKKVQALVGVSLFTALNIILSSYASIRIVKNIIALPFDIAALYYVMKICEKIRRSQVNR